MSAKVFGPDGKEMSFSHNGTKRKPNPYQSGFHNSVIGTKKSENPFSVHTPHANEWDEGWNNYKEKKKRMEWHQKPFGMIEIDESGEWGCLCLVKNHEGFYSHQPLKPAPCRDFGQDTRWVTYKTGVIVRDVIEWAVIPIKAYLKHPIMQPGAY